MSVAEKRKEIAEKLSRVAAAVSDLSQTLQQELAKEESSADLAVSSYDAKAKQERMSGGSTHCLLESSRTEVTSTPRSSSCPPPRFSEDLGQGQVAVQPTRPSVSASSVIEMGREEAARSLSAVSQRLGEIQKSVDSIDLSDHFNDGARIEQKIAQDLQPRLSFKEFEVDLWSENSNPITKGKIEKPKEECVMREILNRLDAIERKLSRNNIT
ncbi:Hypothetical predicted protein [Cloeon dipterum]|uniref:Uncharacterized protein n=1 Tax=Cloeon dipterum TaxID=197152 RepID=A0A8S1DQD2_9INSE|nr:Hypothetical predicted protein [Cloeon dipterum]